MQVYMSKKLQKGKKRKHGERDRCCSSSSVPYDTVALPICGVTPVAPPRYVSAVSDPAHTMSFRVANTVARITQINGPGGVCPPPPPPLLGQVARHSHSEENNYCSDTAQLFKQTKSTGKDLIGHAYFSLRAFIYGQNTQSFWYNFGYYTKCLLRHKKTHDIAWLWL
jgi:hypothetical protein